MPNVRQIQNSFSGGEISRELFGRFDIAKVQSALDTCRNFIILPHGVAANRPGTQFVNEIKNSANQARLLQFSFSATQTFCIELGAGYFRFHTQGATLMSGGVPYEVANSYAQAHLFDIHYVQSGDVITLVHPSYHPAELKRLGNLNWTFSNISFASQTAAPTGVSATATYPTAGSPKNFTYIVTALNSLGYEESPPSAASNSVSNDLTISGNYNTITWSAVSGAIRYNVYKYASGNYGYIGQTTALTFTDDNILADMTKTLPLSDPVFNSANNYPSAVAYYDQRRFFAGSNNQPQNLWATQTASDYNMSYSIPSKDSDALRFKIAAQRANGIKHLIPALDLMAFSASTEWRIFSQSGNALSASTTSIKPQSQNGSSNVSPQTVGNYVLYAAAQGGHIRELSYQWQSSGYLSNDLCLLAPHLFDYNSIIDMTYSRAPTPALWAINNSGQLLGMTYVPEQQVAAWHKHDTAGGAFESCVTVTENNADVLYVIVKRTINGATKRYIECLHSRNFTRQQDAFFVDCGLTYSGAAAATIGGLSHLEGQTVAILGDGAVMPQQTVTGGSITLPHAVSTAQIGLPITADLINPPLTSNQDSAMGQGRVKSINKGWLRVFNSGMFSAGPSADRLTPVKARRFEAPGTPPALMTDEIPLTVLSHFNPSGQLLIRQSNPLPLTVVSLTVEAVIGG